MVRSVIVALALGLAATGSAFQGSGAADDVFCWKCESWYLPGCTDSAMHERTVFVEGGDYEISHSGTACQSCFGHHQEDQCFPEDVPELAEAAAQAGMDAVQDLKAEFENYISITAARHAVQVLNCSGEVVAHYSLP